MSRRFALLAWVLGMLAATASVPAYAKKVRIRWKPVPGATRYELEFRRGETVTQTRETAENVTELRVVLPPGHYRYRIRAYDRAERPGEWSAELPLTVSPTNAKPTTPADGAKVTLRDGADEARLVWTDDEKPDRWRIDIVHNGKTETQFVVGRNKPEWILPEPESGNVRWRVRGEVGGPVEALGAGNRPSQRSSSEWKPGKWSAWSHFTLVVTPEYLRARGRLKAPVIRGPASSLVLPPGGNVELSWEPVTAAQGYEVRLEWQGRKTEPWTAVDGTRHVIQLTPGDRVRWRVRATAGVGPDRVAGPEATGVIVTDAIVRWPEETRIGVHGIAESYRLTTETAAAGLPKIRGTSSGVAAGAGLTVERWAFGRWGYYGNAEYLYRRPGGSVAQALGVVVGATGRFVLGDALSPWSLRGRLGARYQDHPVLEPDNPAPPLMKRTIARRLGMLGPELVVALDYRASPDWLLSLGLESAWPLAQVAGEGTNGIEGTSLFGNWAVVARADWRWSPRWDFRFEAYYRSQSAGTRLAPPLHTVPTTSDLTRIGAQLGVGWRWE